MAKFEISAVPVNRLIFLLGNTVAPYTTPYRVLSIDYSNGVCGVRVVNEGRITWHSVEFLLGLEKFILGLNND